MSGRWQTTALLLLLGSGSGLSAQSDSFPDRSGCPATNATPSWQAAIRDAMLARSRPYFGSVAGRPALPTLSGTR
jgi:hypothetical protein